MSPFLRAFFSAKNSPLTRLSYGCRSWRQMCSTKCLIPSSHGVEQKVSTIAELWIFLAVCFRVWDAVSLIVNCGPNSGLCDFFSIRPPQSPRFRLFGFARPTKDIILRNEKIKHQRGRSCGVFWLCAEASYPRASVRLPPASDRLGKPYALHRFHTEGSWF